MNAREIAEKNKILKFKVGSHLYGTNTPTSDEDFSGVFLPSENMVFGFESIEQVEAGKKSKQDDGKNAPDAIDVVYYELRKFAQLALQNNPNILEMLFVNKDNLVFSTYFGKELLKYNYLFPYKGLKERFLAYAFSQKHKMVIRTDNYHALENAQEWLDDYMYNEDIELKLQLEKTLLVEILDKKLPFMSVKGDNVKIGDLNFQKHFMLRKVKKMIVERLNKATSRKDLLTKHGYDTKFASHLVRLMLEGKELLETGHLEFPLKERQLILDVKLGKYKMVDVLKMGKDFEKEVKNANFHSSLPSKPRYNEVQNLIKKMLKDFFV